MTGRLDSDDEEPSGGSTSGRLLMVAVLALAVASTAVLVLTDSARWLRLGVLAALWAALLGVFLAAKYRKQVADRENEAADLQAVYELELEREVAARREYELEVEAEARKRVDEAGREDLAELRAELRALRENLERLTGGEVLVERFALRAQSTRMRTLSDGQQRIVSGGDEMRRSIAGPGIVDGQPDAIDPQATAFISRVDVPPVVTTTSSQPIRREPQRRESQRPGGYRPEPSRPQTPRDGMAEDGGERQRREAPVAGPQATRAVARPGRPEVRQRPVPDRAQTAASNQQVRPRVQQAPRAQPPQRDEFTDQWPDEQPRSLENMRPVEQPRPTARRDEAVNLPPTQAMQPVARPSRVRPVDHQPSDGTLAARLDGRPASRPAPPRQAAPRTAAPRPAGPPVEPPRAEPSRPESHRAESHRAGPPRAEPSRPEPPRAEPPRSEPGRADPVRSEPPRADAQRADESRSQAPTTRVPAAQVTGTHQSGAHTPGAHSPGAHSPGAHSPTTQSSAEEPGGHRRAAEPDGPRRPAPRQSAHRSGAHQPVAPPPAVQQRQPPSHQQVHAERTQVAEPVTPPERSRHRVSDAPAAPEPTPPPAEPSGGRRRAEDQPVDWQSYREWRQDSGGSPPVAEPEPTEPEPAEPASTEPAPTEPQAPPPAQPAARQGGSRRARDEDDEPQADIESTGAHTAGMSVTDLLAAHGTQDSPRRHRRRAD
jgi:hypothetical protein